MREESVRLKAAALALLTALLAGCHAAPPNRAGTSTAGLPDPTSPELTNGLAGMTDAAHRPIQFTEIQPGIYQLADVRIDRNERTVSFPARLNLIEGPMEYLLVTSWGKIHESVLSTDTQPYLIHTAMLLLGAQGVGADPATDQLPVGGFITHPPNVRIPGDTVSVEVAWNSDGKRISRRAEELIFDRELNRVPRRGDWVYTGSRMYGDIYVAQGDGSVVSLITDAAAMINNEGPDHDNDHIWAANTNQLPPTNLTLEVTIKLSSTKNNP